MQSLESKNNAASFEQHLTFVSKLGEIDGFILDALQREVLASDVQWHEPYSEYASPGLMVAVLLSPDGKEDNFSWKDCSAPKPTPLTERLPVLKRLLDGFGFNIMASRLLKLQPGTYLHEHRDYVYLENVERYRLHVPIVTNARAHIVMPGCRIHLSRGYLWKLNPKEAIHSASNFGSEPRIHLMLDCYHNDRLQNLISQESLPVNSLERLPILSVDEKSLLLDNGRKLIKAGQVTEAEDLVLKQFCLRDLGELTSYQLLYELFGGVSGCEQRLEYWRTRAQDVYPVIAH
ncbi:MAG: aspartyl/asparaginyl beta-hydroxylase domain-containing protein [Candidatus Obscuribacterales bacterium]|nr:aspartyl/asparaginyl beta-hydroxylase domain-containing protein [Candidatus Obscuribacterales bacterium]